MTFIRPQVQYFLWNFDFLNCSSRKAFESKWKVRKIGSCHSIITIGVLCVNARAWNAIGKIIIIRRINRFRFIISYYMIYRHAYDILIYPVIAYNLNGGNYTFQLLELGNWTCNLHYLCVYTVCFRRDLCFAPQSIDWSERFDLSEKKCTRNKRFIGR